MSSGGGTLSPSAKRSGSPPRWLVLIAPAVFTFFFALYPVVVKRYANQGGAAANGYVFTFYREIGAFVVLFGFARYFEGAIPFPDVRTMIIFSVLGFVGMFINQFGYITAVYLLGPDLVSIFIPTISVWTAVLSVMLCTEQLPSPIYVHAWAKYLGILIAVGGAMLLTMLNINSTTEGTASSNQDGSTGDTSLVLKLIGYCGMLTDTLSAALYYVLLKKFILIVPNHPWRPYPITVLAYCYLTSFVFMALSMMYYVASGRTDQFIIPHQSLVALLYAIFITSALCYFLISWSSQYLPSSVMSAYQPLQVPITIIVEYMVFGDQLTPVQYLIAVVIMLGVLCVIYSNYAEEQLFAGHSVARLDRSCCRSKREESSHKRPYVRLVNL